MEFVLPDLYKNNTILDREVKYKDPLMYQLVMVVRYLQQYLIPCIVTLGILSNSLCVATLIVTKLRKRSSSVYLVAICMADLVFLVVLLITWLKTFGIDLMNTGGWCQGMRYVFSISAFLSMWNTVAMVVDKMIFCFLPQHKAAMCTPTQAKIVTLSLLIGATPIYVNLSILYGVYSVNGVGSLCSPGGQFKDAFHILMKLDVAFNIFLPLGTLLVLMVAITIWLVIDRCRNVRNTSDRSAVTQGQMQSTKLVLCVTSTFIVFTFPVHMVQVWVVLARGNLGAHVYLWQQILLHVYYMRRASVFFVCCTVSRSFRKALKEIFQLMIHKFKKPERDNGIEDTSVREALNPQKDTNLECTKS